MSGVERILDRAINEARRGQRDAHYCLVLAGRAEQGDEPRDAAKAMLAVMEAAGGSLTRWQEAARRTAEETLALLEDAMFRVQMT